MDKHNDNRAAKEILFVEFKGASKGKEGRMIVKDDEVKTSNVIINKSEKRKKSLNEIFKTKYVGGNSSSMSATFTKKEVSSLFNISDGRLLYWDKSGFITPSAVIGNRRRYSFSDLISIRSALELLENGVSLQKTRVLISSLSDILPKTSHPMSRLRITGDSQKVTVIEEGREFEVDSGQLVFDFTVQNLEDDVVASLPDRSNSMSNKTAYEWYIEGTVLDEEELTFDKAEFAYHQCITLDPTIANAYINLGNLRFRRGSVEDARALYLKSLEIEPMRPDALYNLGFIEFEYGNLKEAEKLFKDAVKYDSEFTDALYNLAMTLFRLNQTESAATYWKKYLVLEPVGQWADVARRHLAQI
ncbi:MAG: tetratricopeptide repeat protein [Deltaproteobacteria bacterium]|nr:tetratricopeptide repeat protein [Deltaproteobacteria bacterium]